LPKQEKGKAHSVRPVSKRTPSWCKYQSEEVEALVVKLAKEGHSSSRIGTILRDQHAIPLVKPITGRSITQILRESELAPEMPEDLGSLLRKAASLSAHLDKNNRDQHNKRALQTVEARIYKLSKYYKRRGVLPRNWKYQARTAAIV